MLTFNPQGNTVRHDLIAIIGKNGNWRYPSIWAPFLRYLTGPILAIVFSLAYPEFGTVKNDPVHIFGFVFAHVVIILILGGFVVPKWFDIFAPPERLNDGVIDVAPNVMRQDIPGEKRDDSMASVDVPKEGLQRPREGSGDSGSTLRGSVDGIETEKEKGDAADGAGGVFRDPVVQNGARDGDIGGEWHDG
jgi:solute carrier family 6 GABA transporter-like protein 1